MKKTLFAFGMLAWLAVSGGTAYACRVEGFVQCANNGSPFSGVTIHVTGTGCAGFFADSTSTDSTGHYALSMPQCAGSYQACIDATTLPADATLNSAACVGFTVPPNPLPDSTVAVISWTVNSSVCGSIPPPTASCVTITAVEGAPITPVPMVGSGGCGGPYTFTASGLPPGLTISSGGTISGTPTLSGIFNYIVTVTDNCGNHGSINCSVTVSPQSPPPMQLGHGDTATIGFWHNKNGQALILSLNGAQTSTSLGTWLAANFGCLFGNLHGQPNTVVATQFLLDFGVKGEKTYAQIMAVALASYSTSSTLAGGTMAAGFGFNVTPAGTGALSFDVGPYGSAIGLSNNTSYTIAQLLAAANANCNGGMILPGAFDALNNIFDSINSSGDIH